MTALLPSSPPARRRPRYISWREARVGERIFIIPAGTTLAESVEIEGTLEAIARPELGEHALRNAAGFASTGVFRLEGEEILRRLDHWRPVRLY
jgi:hypothetical protein